LIGILYATAIEDIVDTTCEGDSEGVGATVVPVNRLSELSETLNEIVCSDTTRLLPELIRSHIDLVTIETFR